MSRGSGGRGFNWLMHYSHVTTSSKHDINYTNAPFLVCGKFKNRRRGESFCCICKGKRLIEIKHSILARTSLYHTFTISNFYLLPKSNTEILPSCDVCDINWFWKLYILTNAIFARAPVSPKYFKCGHQTSTRWRRRTSVYKGEPHEMSKCRRCRWMKQIFNQTKALFSGSFLGCHDGGRGGGGEERGSQLWRREMSAFFYFSGSQFFWSVFSSPFHFPRK